MINLDQEFLKYCGEGEMKKVEACLTLGADVNTDDSFKSGLSIAAEKINLELLDFLLSQSNINVNQEIIAED